MSVVVFVRTWVVFSLEHKADQIKFPWRDLRTISVAIGIVGFGWGIGWILLAPELSMVNRMIYTYMTTAAMISSMFAYSVNSPTFFAFTLPIMIPSLLSVSWGDNLFPWPFMVGLASLYLVVIGISRKFASTFENSIKLRFRNEELYQALATERDSSIAANIAKSKFIAIASHDLRQPMHAVNVYLDLINLAHLPTLEQQTFGKIKLSITTLNDMFESLLNISKLDSHVMIVNTKVFSLIELVDAIRDLTESAAKAKGLEFEIHSHNINVSGDKRLLQQMLVNLITNAIQYTEQGRIDVTFTDVDEMLQISISDTGCGIATEDQAQIFTEFYRADRTKSAHDGLGLGLSIVKRLSDLIGATMTLSSTLDQGSTFTIQTPFAVIPHQHDAQLSRTSSAAAIHGERNLHGKYVAIFEDDPIIIDAYRQTLSLKGAYVLILSEFDDKLSHQLATIDHIDCILSDHRLQQTTGYALIQKLRENYNFEIPAVIVTADTSPSHFAFFSQLNIPVLHKPISFHQVSVVIENLVSHTPKL
jgi:signal transduction histidine kinase/CheY-like chemotaxis protein